MQKASAFNTRQKLGGGEIFKFPSAVIWSWLGRQPAFPAETGSVRCAVGNTPYARTSHR